MFVLRFGNPTPAALGPLIGAGVDDAGNTAQSVSTARGGAISGGSPSRLPSLPVKIVDARFSARARTGSLANRVAGKLTAGLF
jgi:hypothetical protein